MSDDTQKILMIMKRLFQQAVQPGQYQDFFRKCKPANLREYLSKSMVPENGDNKSDSFLSQLANEKTLSATMKILTEVLEASRETDDTVDSHHSTLLPQELQNFVPISADNRIKESSKFLGKSIQRKLYGEHDSDLIHLMKDRVSTLLKDMRTTVYERCKQENIVKMCDEAVIAANQNFLSVYTAVWNRIKDSDKIGLQKYLEIINTAKIPSSTKDVQPASHPVDLVLQAFLVKTTYDNIVNDIVESLKTASDANYGDVSVNIPPV